MTSGGAALAVGIWYQTLGAGAALVAPWQFTGGPGSTHGESAAVYDTSRLALLSEYFDMDAGLVSESGIRLIQFKATSQQEPPPFGPTEIREIFRNATRAILGHEANGVEPVIGFVVATNRPIGQLKLLQDLITAYGTDRNDPSFLTGFGELEAPATLFPSETEGRTVRELARAITWGKASEWGLSSDQCIDACLRALSLFVFAPANHVNLLEALHNWFYTWGILPTERETYTANILGQLLSQSLNGTASDDLSLMRKAFNSESAVPITPRYIWKAVVADLTARIWPDPPTPHPIRANGIESWMLDRSELLKGLPYSFSGTVDDTQVEGDPYSSLVNGPERIFVVVGPGGSGKSILMAQLFTMVAASVWDWEAEAVRNDAKFIGCPIIQAAEPDALAGIETSMKRWSGRREAVEQTVERIALANGIDRTAPAVWFGIDGMDEVSIDQLQPLARVIANYADGYPGLRVVLTSRPDQFRTIKNELNGKGMLRELRIDEFEGDEPIQAALRATEYGLRIDKRVTVRLEVGSREPTAKLADTFFEPSAFEQSIRQPLFVGVIRQVYEAGRLEVIQRAYEGDLASLKVLASEYVYTFCERVHRRLANPYITARQIFQALKKLAIDAANPTATNALLWQVICETLLDGHISWNELYRQCISSGLIRRLGAGAFEWRHPLVGEHLPYMEERPTWE